MRHSKSDKVAGAAKTIEQVKVPARKASAQGEVHTVPRQETVAEGRARRLRALQKIAGIWKDRQDIPVDGLEYQRLMRNE